MKIDKEWLGLVVKLDFAFQPIVETKNGKIFAVEVFLRDTEKIGFANILDFFNKAFEKNELYNTDLLLRSKALHKFIDIDIEDIVMFYNLDSRILFDKSYTKGNTTKILEKFQLKKKSICFEISDRGTNLSSAQLDKMIESYKSEGFKIALDDFGDGMSCFELLHQSNPYFLKINDFFIKSIENDKKKQLILQSVVKLAHALDLKVIVKNVETQEELKYCKKCDVDFVQGHFIQKPQRESKKLQKIYEI